MAEDEGFLGRWSRRKQAQKTAPAATETAKPAPAPADATMDKAEMPPKEPEPVDLASLPPIDSLGADSDYTAFLRPGVPQSMQIAALRRLWLTEPSVRNYEALVDYAWDFNAPGYGKLLPTDDVEKLLKAVFGEREAPRATVEEAPVQASANVSEPPKIAVQNDPVRRSESSATVPLPEPPSSTAASPAAESAAYPDAAPKTGKPKRHGAALPQPPSDTDEA